MKKPNTLAYLFALLNAAIVGFSFLFTKNAINVANPIDSLFFRFAVGFLLFLVLMLFGILKVTIHFKSYIKLLPLTIFFPLFFFGFQAFGLQTVPSTEAGILFATIPILTTFFAAIFLKETTTTLQKLSIFISVFGVVYIFFMKSSNLTITSWSGMGLLFISCLSSAAYTILTRKMLRSFKPLEITFFVLFVGFTCFGIMSIVTNTIQGTISTMFHPWANIDFVMAMLFLGIGASFLTSLLSNYILVRITASQMIVFSNLSTVISIGAGAIFLGEHLSYYHIIGAILIVVGVVGTNIFKQKQPTNV